MVTPLMSCSARLPVYTLLISMFVPSEQLFWIFNMQGMIMMLMYLIGLVTALFAAFVFKLFITYDQKSFYVMEMPVYHMPRWKNVWLTMYQRSGTFVWEAGKIIVAVSVVLWMLASYAPAGKFEAIEIKYQDELAVAENTAVIQNKIDSSHGL